MSDSLRDQLLGLGFKPAPKPDKPAKPAHAKSSGHGAPRDGADKQRRGTAGVPSSHERGQGREQRDGRGGRTHSGAAGKHAGQAARPRTQQEIDLGKAYALRAEREKQERIEAERIKQEEARKRREAKARLAELVKDKALNDKDAEIARHFEYGGKIKRIYVNPEQLKRLNAGELGVLQLDGRYLLVEAALLIEAEAVFAPAVALKIDPNAPAADDPYADPQYQVPDDLVW